jgi:Fic family protein
METDMREILKYSNWIEREYSKESLEDALSAWKYAKANIDKISIDYILKIHYLLMRRIRPDIAGKIRNCDVWIGGRLKMFISETLIKSDLMMNVCFEMISYGDFDKEEKSKLVHVIFEAIHPFEDGNGRTGRILWNIHRIRLGLKPKLIRGPNVGEDLTNDQIEYYKLFQ